MALSLNPKNLLINAIPKTTINNPISPEVYNGIALREINELKDNK